MVARRIESIRSHYARAWSAIGTAFTWGRGPVSELPDGFCVLEFAPRDDRRMWTYVTCGMSLGTGAQIELHAFAPRCCPSELVELLTAVAHFHLTGPGLNLHDTADLGRPWLDDSECRYGLVSLPYLDGPRLEWDSAATRYLWLVPITAQEREYKRVHGVEALERRFEAASVDYLDVHRTSVV